MFSYKNDLGWFILFCPACTTKFYILDFQTFGKESKFQMMLISETVQ